MILVMLISLDRVPSQGLGGMNRTDKFLFEYFKKN